MGAEEKPPRWKVKSLFEDKPCTGQRLYIMEHINSIISTYSIDIETNNISIHCLGVVSFQGR